MHPIAVGFVLLSAIGHVCWHCQVKRSPAPVIYTWWLMALGALLFAPLAVWLAWPLSLPPIGWYCIGATGLFYAGYYSLMAHSYEREDLSRAYPIARGVAPLATVAWGVLFHGEHPSLAGWLGITGVSIGVLALGYASLREGKSTVPKAFGILAAVGTGLCTSGYSAVDKEGVKHVHLLLYIVLTFAAGALVQGALLWLGRGWRVFAAEASRLRRDAGAGLPFVAALGLGSYLLILWVLRTEPVSYVVTVRSVAVLLSVFAGTRWLGERGAGSRLAAAALIVAGITAIAVGG
ncbi:MAG: EamA family transporter [Armatimonadetes bacterium]|nr:EamA family transporter [Armatimonadota bacterium]